MGLNINRFKTTKAAIEGKWFSLEGGAKVLVAKYNNPKFRRRLRDLLAEDKYRTREEDQDFIDECTRIAFSECILLDWDNLDDDSGPILYSPAKCLDLITEYPEFYEIIQTKSMSRNEFTDEEDSKN